MPDPDYLIHNFEAEDATVTRANVSLGKGTLTMAALGRVSTGGKMEGEIQIREEGKSPIMLRAGLVWSGASHGDIFWNGSIKVTAEHQLRFSIWNDTGAAVPCRGRFQIE